MPKESVDLMQSIFDDSWNRANTKQRKPVIMDITTLDPGRGKRFDLNRSDAIFLYETAHSEEHLTCSMASNQPYQRHSGHTDSRGRTHDEDGR